MELDAVLMGGTQDPSEVRSLRTWLDREPALRSAQISLISPQAREDTLGSLHEAIHFLFTEGVPLIEITLSLAHWRRTRKDPPKVFLVLPEGEAFLVVGADAKAVEKISKMLEDD